MKRALEYAGVTDKTLEAACMKRLCIACLALVSTATQAHLDGDGSARASWFAWVSWSVLLGCGVLYLAGVRKLWQDSGVARGLSRWQAAAFCVGWLVLVAALVPRVEELSQVSFALHMAQHEVLMLVAAPLLVLGKPLAGFIWGMPLAIRHAVSRPFRTAGSQTLWRWLVTPLVAWSLHALTLWMWHTPAWFEAGLHHPAMHDLQHACFLFSALIFWWALVRRRPDHIAVLYLLTTLLHTGFLGALLTFAPNVWYPTYRDAANPWGLTPLADQQLGGLIMWVPAGVVFMLAGLFMLARWLRTLEQPRRAAWSPRAEKS